MGEGINELYEGCGKKTKYGDGEERKKCELKKTKGCIWEERGKEAQHCKKKSHQSSKFFLQFLQHVPR